MDGFQVSQIHRQLPPGGILVFLTGQREVESLCKRLRSSLKNGRPTEAREVDPKTKPNKAEDEEKVGDDDIGMEDGFGEDAAEAAEDHISAGKGGHFPNSTHSIMVSF